MSIFRGLVVYHDPMFRSAAMNMAIDEALLERALAPSIRFYRWNSPALSFGYFVRFAEVAHHIHQRDLVRRWTGGGIVFHGEDLTYSIVVPSEARAFAESSTSIYEGVHRALRHALAAGMGVLEFASVAALCARRVEISPTVADRRYRKSDCFANPVQSDLMFNGRKIAGAAQRRTRRGVLQQGSIQNITLTDDVAQRFAHELADVIEHVDLDARLVVRAGEIAKQKYATQAWLERR
jgi:lipoate-protein ligase A